MLGEGGEMSSTHNTVSLIIDIGAPGGALWPFCLEERCCRSKAAASQVPAGHTGWVACGKGPQFRIHETVYSE